MKCIWDKSSEPKRKKTILCTKWKCLQHYACIEGMRDQDVYVCCFCQLLLTDIFNVPVRTIVEPVRSSLKYMSHSIPFSFQKWDVAYKKANSTTYVELRGLRLSKDGYKNSYPNFCSFKIEHSPFKKQFCLPEREQSRKRKDMPIDVTEFIHIKSDK